MLGDHLSREATASLRLFGNIGAVTLYLLGVFISTKSVYGGVGGVILLAWLAGVSLYDKLEERSKRIRRQMSKVVNFSQNYGMSSERVTFLLGGGDIRSDPAELTPGGENVQFSESTTIHLNETVRIPRYERIADPSKWVV